VATAETLIVDDPAAELAGRLAAAASAGANVALTGGSTPRVAYQHAAGLDADWSGATIWFGDDRCVPPDHEYSNYGMAKGALLDRIQDGAPAVHRIKGELGPGEGAADYQRQLRDVFPGDEPPQLDLVLLGLGPDAHCASLFPRNPELGEQERWAVGVNTPGMAPLVPRVTLTLPVLNAAREVVFLVTGQDKAPAVRRAFAGPPDPDAPASLIAPVSGSLTVLLDAAAASELPGGGAA
jgi:6-phosphogluconolactonase